MTTAPKAEKTPKFTTDSNVEALYSVVIKSGEDAIAEAYNFITALDVALKSGTTQADAQGTMKEMAKGLVKPLVTYSHVPAIPTTAAIIAKKYPDMDKFSPAKILSIGGRVLADVKASGVKAHLAKFASVAELDENTKTKAESQADAKAESTKEEIAELAPAITTESVIENFVEFFKGKNLQDLSTTDLASTKKAIGILIAISKNTEAKKTA